MRDWGGRESWCGGGAIDRQGDCGVGEVKFVAAQGRMVERTEKMHIFAYQSLTEKGVSDENEKIVDKGIVAIG